jgi:hypothetical protein
MSICFVTEHRLPNVSFPSERVFWCIAEIGDLQIHTAHLHFGEFELAIHIAGGAHQWVAIEQHDRSSDDGASALLVHDGAADGLGLCEQPERQQKE